MLNEQMCWDAVSGKDRNQDGKFVFGVMTTGVYCRPSCPGRRPLRKNVRFYETPAEAERDGLRACLRCRPLAAAGQDPNTERIQALCDYIRQNCGSGEALSLKNLSERASLSPFHLQRSFKAVVGLTPKQFIEACRMESLKSELRSGRPVTDAIYEAGFGSGSRVYERADTRLGMTPAEYRAGGRKVAITYVLIESPLGPLMIGATDRGLCFLEFGDSREELEQRLRREYPAAAVAPMKGPVSEPFHQWVDALTNYLRGEPIRTNLPVDVQATAFQLKVWKYLQSIPAGEVRSYSEVARAIGEPKAARAVARACATNPVAIAIPCHRVIRENGELGGYRWGIERKRVLVDKERAAATAESHAV